MYLLVVTKPLEEAGAMVRYLALRDWSCVSSMLLLVCSWLFLRRARNVQSS